MTALIPRSYGEYIPITHPLSDSVNTRNHQPCVFDPTNAVPQDATIRNTIQVQSALYTAPSHAKNRFVLYMLPSIRVFILLFGIKINENTYY